MGPLTSSPQRTEATTATGFAFHIHCYPHCASASKSFEGEPLRWLPLLSK